MPTTRRVLVADDDVDICALIATVFKRAPYAMTTCHDAESALVRIQRESPFDIIICDFMLPGISGIELITQIRNNDASALVPIVMMSGHNNYSMNARAKIAGANAFLNKPFTLLQLRTTVQSLLEVPVSSVSPH